MEAKKRRGVNIPHDIREEILVKVPVKSLVRFKAVSKEWRGAIESKFFVDKHVRYQKSLGGQVRLVEVERKRLTLKTLRFMSTNGIVNKSPYRLIRLFFMSTKGIVNYFPYQLCRPRLFPNCLKISEPCDGLFCIYTEDREFNLVNPATNSQRILPDPTIDVDESIWSRPFSLSLIGIGRENGVSPRYKLVWFFEVKSSTRCKVFALDSNTWRFVDPPNCLVYEYQRIIHLDGVLYCFGFFMEEKPHTGKYIKKLLAFDLHTETFQSFSITPDIGSVYMYECHSMCVLNHRLCIFKKCHDINTDGLFFKIWGLDINKRSWEILYSIDLSRLPPDFDTTRIIPVAAVNNFVILSNYDGTIWVLYGSKTHIFRGTFSFSKYFMFFETLVSVYQ